ncbi:G-type lectin S-receptor-like serine/threonine-protein kinase SD2-5 [Carex rostrata]
MAFTPSLALVALLLCFPFFVNPQLYNYPTASAPVLWTNSPSQNNTFYYGETSPLLLRLNVTHGLSFATGFHCFDPCKSFFLSIYIVQTDYYMNSYYYLSQVIWSANRAHPVSENATLELTSKDGLILRDSDGSLVWSTNVMNRSVAGINITEVGNLVLFDINNSTIWQSFDHPTDCLVMGQTLAGGMRIIASSSNTDLAEGQFYLTLHVDGLYGFVVSDPPLMYYHNNLIYTKYDYGRLNRTGDKFIFIKFMDGNLTMFSTLSNTDMGIIIPEMPLAKSIQYIRLESDGHLRLYDYDEYSRWKMVADLLDMDECDYPTVCGHYGICNNGQCTCPAKTLENYFKPIDNQQAELGCNAVNNITCHDVNNHHLLNLPIVSYFNTIDNVAFDTIDEETCKKACLGDCKCKAALFQSTNGRCLTLPEVFSLHIQPDDQFTAYIKVQVAPSPPSTPPPHHSSKVGLGAILGFTFGALLFMLTLVIFYIVCFRRREEEQDEDIIDQLPGMPTRFTLEELRAATENFFKILGKGGFGTVFEGRWGDRRIAVKRLDNVGHGNKDFLAEVETIGSIHHINLVRMIGFCADKLNRLLVYEYMCNGSLDQWIYCRDERVSLDWPTRIKIITDIAKGLRYLHEDCTQKIVHFDIKPENILLDEKFNAKVSDFGLAKLIDKDISRVMTKMRGTPGYLAPEWLTAMVTEKVDVYSFGVVVMEILCGRRNLDDSQTEENHHLIKLLEEKSKTNGLSDLIDNNLGDVELYKKEIVNVMELAMWCLQWDSIRRPSMLIVVKVLEGAMEVETSLDYNFVSSIPMIVNIPGVLDQSTPFSASVLSGPR